MTYLVNVKVINDGIKTSVQIIEQRDNLWRNRFLFLFYITALMKQLPISAMPGPVMFQMMDPKRDVTQKYPPVMIIILK